MDSSSYNDTGGAPTQPNPPQDFVRAAAINNNKRKTRATTKEHTATAAVRAGQDNQQHDAPATAKNAKRLAVTAAAMLLVLLHWNDGINFGNDGLTCYAPFNANMATVEFHGMMWSTR